MERESRMPEELQCNGSAGAFSENVSSLNSEVPAVQHLGQFSHRVSVFLIVLMVLMVMVTVLGNALVILAFAVDRSLRTRGNFFFLNLAIADILVGGFCIPLYIPYVITGKWKLGRGLCKVWLVMDYLLCTASVFNIVLISFDRFTSVTRSVNYRAQKGVTRPAVLKMVLVWIAAFLLYGPAIISWEYIVGKSILPNEECYAEFYYNWYFLITASTVEFFTPFVSVTYFNVCIYINIRRRTVMRKNASSSSQNSFAVQGRRKRCVIFFVKPSEKNIKGKSIKGNKHPPANQQVDKNTGNKPDWQSFTSAVDHDLPPLEMEVLSRHTNASNKTKQNISSDQHQTNVVSTTGQNVRLSKDKKVAKSLAIIVCVFGLCWAPYTLLMIIRAACHGRCVQHSLYEISFWLLWFNSSINPVLYPLCHLSFRKAFIKLLCPTKIKIHPQMLAQN